MKYNSTFLILDNFRSVLSGFSIDLQDVVRSAILDGVDLEPWIDACKDQPYKLDQIRLSLKEGMDSDVIFNGLTGAQLYSLRGLRAAGYSVDYIETQLKDNRLVGEYLDYLLQWLSKGYNISSLKVSIIPKSMLKIFDTCLSKGFNVLPFNNGKEYSAEYINYCFLISKSGKPYERFAEEDWNINVLKSVMAPMSRKLSRVNWVTLMGVVDKDMPADKVSALANMVQGGLPLAGVNIAALSAEDLNLALKAFTGGYSYKTLLADDLTTDERAAMLREMQAKRGAQVGGRLPKPLRRG